MAMDWKRPICQRCGVRNVILNLTICETCYVAVTARKARA